VVPSGRTLNYVSFTRKIQIPEIFGSPLVYLKEDPAPWHKYLSFYNAETERQLFLMLGHGFIQMQFFFQISLCFTYALLCIFEFVLIFIVQGSVRYKGKLSLCLIKIMP